MQILSMTQSTHPQTPSAREGAFNPPRKSSLRESATLLKVANSWQSIIFHCDDFSMSLRANAVSVAIHNVKKAK
ncbi:hypothetical protein [Helicobacter sp. T3_23-1056]